MKNNIYGLITLIALIVFIAVFNFLGADMKDLMQAASIKDNPSTNSDLYGAKAAKVDTDLTLEDMLTYAIQDEYLAKARYSIAIEKFGKILPFTNILSSEETHINLLVPLFEKYNIKLPDDTSMNYVKIPTNIKDSIEAGISGEIDNTEMYESFLNKNIPVDVSTTFDLLKKASQNHLEAFKKALKGY